MKLNLDTLFLLLTIMFMTACSDTENNEEGENNTQETPVQTTQNESSEMKKDIYIDRNHREELQAAILIDLEGNLILPAKQMMGKDEDFHRTFRDDFKRAGPWVEERTRVSDLYISDSSYYIKHKDKKKSYFVFVPLAIDGQLNWAIETQLSKRNLPDSSKYGLVFGMDEETGNKHLFYIDCNNKLLSIANVETVGQKLTINNRPCKAIDNNDNVLRIECIDEFWYYYVNDHLVYCEAARKLYKDKFGIGIDGSGSISSDYFQIQW
jgi:hypothetical protein